MKIDTVTRVVLATIQTAGYATTLKAKLNFATDSKRGKCII